MTLCRLFGLVLAVLMMVVEATAQLPPDIQADRYLVEAERHIGNGDSAAAKAALDRILSLQAEHDLALPEAFWFKHAQVSLQAGSYAEAVESVTRYLTTAGREGAHYREALELLDQATAAAGEQQEAERLAEEIRRMPRTVRNGIGMEFVLIEPGTFEMGSPETESGRADNEGPVHEVTLGQPFYLGKYEVTQGQWEAVMGNNPSRFDDCGRTCPVERVSWEDAQAFIAELNRREGVGTYRLPTEAEWEYAARGGRQSGGYVYAGSNRLSSVGWYTENSGDKTHPVGRKQPNELGLYDMSGNVWEWVQDWYDDDYYSSSPATDPRGPSSGAAGSFAAGVGTATPAIAARHIALGLRRAIATASSVSAWREPLNPVHCYPLTLCHGGQPSRVLSRRAHSGRREWGGEGVQGALPRSWRVGSTIWLAAVGPTCGGAYSWPAGQNG